MEEWREKVYRFWARQKWVMPLCFIMSLINVFLVILFLELRRFSGMDNYFTFTLGADIVSLFICSALLYSIIQDKNAVSRHTHDFMILISSVSTVLFTDACCWIVQGVESLRTWNIVANILNYIGCVFLVFFLWRYVSTALEVKGRFGNFATITMNILLAPALILCLINIFVPFYFSVDEAGIYQREPAFPLSQVYFAIGLIILIIEFIISKESLKKKIIIGSSILIPVGHQVLTGYAFGLTSGFSAMLISIVLMFGVVVAGREKTLIATEKELYEAKVNVMVSQIRPHFMYNALSSIAILCKLNPDTAYDATIAFSDYLRGNMDSLRQTSPVPFERELEHLKKYLYIEKLRFQDKLNIKYDIQAKDFEIPLLSIQPLVENAVKHGVGMKDEGGCVEIITREEADHYEVIIADDGVGFDPGEVKKDDGRSHIGMENTKKRLHDMCDATIETTSAPGEGTTVRIILPKSGQDKEDDSL